MSVLRYPIALSNPIVCSLMQFRQTAPPKISRCLLPTILEEGSRDQDHFFLSDANTECDDPEINAAAGQTIIPTASGLPGC